MDRRWNEARRQKRAGVGESVDRMGWRFNNLSLYTGSVGLL